MKTDLFQSCGHCWVFQICWHIECNTFPESSFRIWNSSPGLLSPPLVLFVAMLPKAHLTSYYRMSGSRWVITPSSLSGSWRSFLCSPSVYSCHLFLIYSALLGPYHFCPLLSPSLLESYIMIVIFHKAAANSELARPKWLFLKEIQSQDSVSLWSQLLQLIIYNLVLCVC